MFDPSDVPGRRPEAASRATTMSWKDTQIIEAGQENGGTEGPFPTAWNTTLMRDTELLRGVEPGAQVWATYVQETKVFDNELVERWNRGLDVTLGELLRFKRFRARTANEHGVLLTTVFAALFSAIVTVFVLESIKLLRPDPGQGTMDVLSDISQVLHGMAAGQPPTLKQPDTSGRGDFHLSAYSIWINSLFFLSLSLSIAASLVAMLAKQWCYNFLCGRTGDSIHQAEMRQRMFSGIEKWRMGDILEMVPVLMHISVGFFSVGLALYLWDINVVVSLVVTILAGATAAFYFGTMLLSVIFKNCPFVTPQGEWVRHTIKRLGTLIPVRKTPSDPNNLGNGSKSTDHINSIPCYSPPTQKAAPPTKKLPHAGASTREEQKNSATKQDNSPYAKHPPFILEALSWLITNSRNSKTIGTAIGAWAIARLELKKIPRRTSVDTFDLEHYIKSFLVSNFSACFKSSPELGVKLKLLDDGAHLSLALDYSRWITYFANESEDGIRIKLKALLGSGSTGRFVHLGLAFASLAESRCLSSHDAKNVVMWLSAFTSLYTKDMELLFTDRALAAMIDGITVASLSLAESGDAKERQKLASNLGISYLVQILSEVDLDSSKLQLRSSVVLNLAVFALRAKFAYPFDPDRAGFDAQANQLVDDFQSGKLSLSGELEGYSPLVILSLVGLIHPKSQLDLNEGTTRKICELIKRASFFGPLDLPYCFAQPIHRITNPSSFRCHLSQMLLEAMVSTPETCASHLQTGIGENSTRPSSLLQEASTNDSEPWSESQEFLSLLDGICKLICDHFSGTVKLHPDVLVAATQLLLREVKYEKEIDLGTLFSNMPPTDASNEPKGSNPALSHTLTRIMTESNNPRCINSAIGAIIHHSKGRNVDSVIDMIAQFADNFCSPYGVIPERNRLDEQESILAEDQKWLVLSGYSRLLAAMITFSSEPGKLSERLQDRVSSMPDGAIWELKLRDVRAVYDRLMNKTTNTQISAFAVSGLAIWDTYTPPVSPIAKGPGSSEHAATVLLQKSWDIIEKHFSDRNQLPSEALETLINATVRLAAGLTEVPDLTPLRAQIILDLIARFSSGRKARSKAALSVALAFWGLSLDKPAWKFWGTKDRKAYREQYSSLAMRMKDKTALLLIGLSRTLSHYSVLQLGPDSIKIIAHEIHNRMSTHSGDSCNLALDFLSPGLTFDIRRHVRESVWQYLEETEKYKPFSGATNDVRELLRTAVFYDGGEGYSYQAPQPFIRATASGKQK